MLNKKSIVAIIPARGGSKGIPQKNIKSFAGKPLIAWTIETAQQSHYIDRIILSSDDTAIRQVACNYGCDIPFKRPAHLAKDDTPGIAPILHALEHLPSYDYVLVLQATSPLRSSADIDACIAYCLKQKSPACVSVSEAAQNPFWMYTRQDNGTLRALLPGEQPVQRQTLPSIYALNGALYLAKCSWLQHHKSFLSEETLSYIMPAERSIDIDTPTEFAIAETLATMSHTPAFLI